MEKIEQLKAEIIKFDNDENMETYKIVEKFREILNDKKNNQSGNELEK